MTAKELVEKIRKTRVESTCSNCGYSEGLHHASEKNCPLNPYSLLDAPKWADTTYNPIVHSVLTESEAVALLEAWEADILTEAALRADAFMVELGHGPDRRDKMRAAILGKDEGR